MQLGYRQVGRKSRKKICPVDSTMTAKAHQGAWSMPPDLDSRHWYHEDAFPGYEADFLEYGKYGVLLCLEQRDHEGP